MTVYFSGNGSKEQFHQVSLVAGLQTSLRETVFSSGLSISPRRINQIGQTIANGFVSFCEESNPADSHALGRVLALEGLGPRSVLVTMESLRRVYLASAIGASDVSELAGAFVNSLLEGYMLGREEQLLEIQERTHRAHLAALARLQEGSDRSE